MRRVGMVVLVWYLSYIITAFWICCSKNAARLSLTGRQEMQPFFMTSSTSNLRELRCWLLWPALPRPSSGPTNMPPLRAAPCANHVIFPADVPLNNPPSVISRSPAPRVCNESCQESRSEATERPLSTELHKMLYR